MVNKQLRVAIVCDWLIGGGAEKVVHELHKMYPRAPIYTSYATNEWRRKLTGQVRAGYLQNWPFSSLRKFIPFLRGWWFSGLDLSQYDLVISSAGAEAKFVKVGRSNGQMASGKIIGKWKKVNGKSNVKQPLHISYIHAPTHYYWSRYDDYLKNPGFGALDWLARLGLKILVGPMRRWDYRAAQRPHHLIANSNYTKDQIKKYYGRDSTVIHPPVDIDRFKLLNKSSILRRGFVTAGRQTPYKRIDLAVAACTKLGLPLIVIGYGPEHKKLRKMAGPTISFTGKIPTKQVAEYFRSAEAFIFPGLDDFGIAAVEAMAAGTPVIAYKAGGALDYVSPGETGLFFNQQTVESLASVLENFRSDKFNSDKISVEAQNFSKANFDESFRNYLRAL